MRAQEFGLIQAVANANSLPISESNEKPPAVAAFAFAQWGGFLNPKSLKIAMTMRFLFYHIANIVAIHTLKLLGIAKNKSLYPQFLYQFDKQ